jgi:hypothetical protein
MRGSISRPAHGEKGVNIVNDYFHQNIVRTPITESFTSNKNVKYLMTAVQQAIQNVTGKVIGPQPIQYLASIMKNQYVLQGPYMVHLPDQEVERLNRAVLQIFIHETVQGMQAYDRYLKDSQTQPVPPDRPQNSSQKGSRQFEINYFI